MDQDHEDIPLHSPRPVSEEKEEQEEIESENIGSEFSTLLADASRRIGMLCAEQDDWELMEGDAEAPLLCFTHRRVPCRYRIAGHLKAEATTIIAHLKDMPKGAVLKASEIIKSFSDNVEEQTHVICMPAPFTSHCFTVAGFQHCVYMNDSNRYLYIFVSDDTRSAATLSCLLGVWIHELEKGCGCEVEVVFEWTHLHSSSWTWLSDRWIEMRWLNPSNLIQWTQWFST
jgi:hypothetical protein